jgi:hypothetical protein
MKRWEHEHCEMCWARFMDPQIAAGHAQVIGEYPDVLGQLGFALGEGSRTATVAPPPFARRG